MCFVIVYYHAIIYIILDIDISEQSAITSAELRDYGDGENYVTDPLLFI